MTDTVSETVVDRGRRRSIAAAVLPFSVVTSFAAFATGPASGSSASPTRPGGSAPVSPPMAAGAALIVRSRVDGSLHVVDADSPRPARRVALPPQVLEAVVVTADGADAYFATADGRVGRIDVASARLVAEAKVADRLAGLAVSADGTHVAVASVVPPALLVFDRALASHRRLDALDAAGTRAAAVVAVVDAAARRSFVAALPGIGEIWEVSYDPTAPDIPTGMIHDFQYREGTFVRGYMNPRRTRAAPPPHGLVLDPAMHELLVATDGANSLQVVHLDVRRRIASLQFASNPRPERGTTWHGGGRKLVLVPQSARGVLAVDAGNWRTLAELPTAGEIAAVVANARSQRIWMVHARDGPRSDSLQPLDAASLELGEPWRPAPGRAATAAAFGPGAATLFVAVDGADGWIAAFDPASLRERWRVAVPWPAAMRVAGAAAAAAAAPAPAPAAAPAAAPVSR